MPERGKRRRMCPMETFQTLFPNQAIPIAASCQAREKEEENGGIDIHYNQYFPADKQPAVECYDAVRRKVKPAFGSMSTVTRSPSENSPPRIRIARGSSIRFWRARRRGLAP